MSEPRLLTLEEAAIIRKAVDDPACLQGNSFATTEYASRLLASAVQRPDGCARRDVASLGRAILLEHPRELEPYCIWLAPPGQECVARGRVSILGDLGLACVGRLVCSTIELRNEALTFIGFADTGPAHLNRGGGCAAADWPVRA